MDVDVLGLMIRIRSGGGAGFEAMMMIGYGLWMAKCRGGSRRRKDWVEIERGSRVTYLVRTDWR